MERRNVMKKVAMISVICMLFALPLFAQVFEDYVDHFDGSTAVINEFWDMGDGEPSTLINAIELDTDAPADRVYELKTNGWYPFSRALTSPEDRAIVIMGTDDTPLVENDGTDMPPLITGYTDGTNTNTGILGFQNDVTIKNCMILGSADDGSYGWAPIGASAPNNTLTLDNVLMETTRWVMVQSNDHAGNSLILSNCYFVNLSGQACRRNGGVYDNVSNPTKDMIVENCTHVMAQGMMYKFRNFPLENAMFNHNTFVNCSGQIFETLGYQNKWSVTNNLFVNSHIQPYLAGLDYGETDPDSLPMGLINVAPFPALTGDFEGLTEAGRQILVHKNGLYWDPAVDAILPAVNAAQANGSDQWVSQMIKMNTRTQNMFDDDATYPLLTEGEWIEAGDPGFTDPANLLTDGLEDLITYTEGIMDDDGTATLPWWRTAGNPIADNFIYPDWPIPVDLSYTNAAYLSGGYGGFPVGDMNWFPAQKATWAAQKDAEHTQIETDLSTGNVPVDDAMIAPNQFKLAQNYPNPFNPATTIEFSVPVSGNVTLKVFDAMGKEVATLVNDYRNAGQSYKVKFNGAELSSGMYIYKLSAGDYQVSRKMLLMK